MAPEDIQGEAQEQAAQSLSRILTEAGVDHAFIGGFAAKVLGSTRPTADIDVEINVTESREIIDRIRPLLLQEDHRFSIEHLKLYFTRDDDQRCRIPVETLRIGTLGLPCRLSVIRPGVGMYLSLTPLYTAESNLNSQEISRYYTPAYLY
jgi:hypothetical protein